MKLGNQKFNESMVDLLITSLSKKDAIIAIAKAITHRDELIRKAKGK
tara:strand:+ start:342 stop:482 length:141 start_codon:yes stop_codon:yes gene_type:complete